MSPAVVEDLKGILILPHGKTIKHYKAELEEKLKINDSLVAKDYTPNTEMNKRIAATIRKKDQTWIKCGLAMDHVALNVQTRKLEDMILVKEGKYNGKFRPTSHLCCFVLTPYDRDLPKFLIFAQQCYDGKAR